MIRVILNISTYFNKVPSLHICLPIYQQNSKHPKFLGFLFAASVTCLL